MSVPLLFLSWGEAGDSACLGRSELERYEGIKAPLRRSQFLSAHSLLHLALNFYSGQERHPYDVKAPAGQAPRIAGGPQVSLSHSGQLSACLVSPLGPCGLDVEDARIERDFAALAAHSFEGNAVKNASHSKGFYETWCLKEALYKAKNPLGGASGLFHFQKFQGALWLHAARELACYQVSAGSAKKMLLEIAWL